MEKIESIKKRLSEMEAMLQELLRDARVAKHEKESSLPPDWKVITGGGKKSRVR